MHASRKRMRRANESENDNKIQFINREILSRRWRDLNERFKIVQYFFFFFFFIKDFILFIIISIICSMNWRFLLELDQINMGPPLR